MRRLLALCAVTVTICAAIAALQGKRTGIVSAANGPNNLILVGIQSPGGCPVGPGYTFCDQVPGTKGPTEILFVNNTAAVSGATVSLAAVVGLSADFANGDFTITSNSCTGSLAANQQCEIGVAFSPTTAGFREAALTMTDTQGDMLVIDIDGTGSTLAIAPNTESCTTPDNAFTYCSEPVGSASGASTFTLSAAAAETGIEVSLLPITGLAPEFSASDFTVTTTSCTGALPALGNCTVSVEFTPHTAGMRAAALTATDANGDSTTINLAGQTTSGLSFPMVGPSTNSFTCARVNPLGFCNEPQGGTSAAVAFTVTNTSGTEITGLTISPPVPTLPPAQPSPPPTNFTSVSTSCDTTLAANTSCVVNVAFTPLTTGPLQGEIMVTDAQGDVTGLNLSGTGDDFNMQIVANQPMELTVTQGGTATFMAQLNADSVFGQNGEQVTLVCPTNLPAFTTCAFKPCPIAPKIAGSVPFGVVIVTSSSTTPAPQVPNPCDSPAADVAPGPQSAPPSPRVTAKHLERVSLFPALLPLFAATALGLGVLCALRSSTRLPARTIFAAAMIFGAFLLGCGGGNGATKPTPTPVATTTMNVVANATDASGNPLNASRGLQIILDVIK